MKQTTRLIGILFGLLLLAGFTASIARADDGIFPPAPAAAPYINFDGRGFLVNGSRTFLASGGLEYCRIPRTLWRDRLLRLKRAGFNTVEIYNMWNFHEPKKGQFDFSGDHDLNAFLKLVKAMGLYAVVRVGPYVCAEWDSGGYPVWLRFEPGMRVREHNPQFEAAVDRYWEKLIPIVAANQINRGGPVIMVQLENEHPQGWGKEMPNAYFTHLRDKAVSLGLQVPYFFSGLHHGSDPAGNNPWSSAGRTNPWYTRSSGRVWYDHYNQTEDDARTYDRRMWKVLAYGGNGLNFYMLHGGTNFDTWNDDEDTSSYDYGAAIGQAGDLRPTLLPLQTRRTLSPAVFRRSWKTATTRRTLSRTPRRTRTSASTARQSPAGTILFLDQYRQGRGQNAGDRAGWRPFSRFRAADCRAGPDRAGPCIIFRPLPGVTLDRSTPLLGIFSAGPHDDHRGARRRRRPGGDEFRNHFSWAAGQPCHARLDQSVEDSRCARALPRFFRLTPKRRQSGILILSDDLADRTWLVDNSLVIGPEYIGDMALVNGKMQGVEEISQGAAADSLVYGPDSQPHTLIAAGSACLPAQCVPALTAWQMRRGDAQAQTDFKDASWKVSTDPLPMGADGDYGAYAWYRTSVTVPKAGIYALRPTNAGDWLSVFVNGKHAVSSSARRPITLALPAGTSPLAVLAAHYGRPKLFGYLGPIDKVDIKGLGGPVVLDVSGIPGQAIITWRVKNDNTPDKAAPPTDTTGPDWRDAQVGEDVFNKKRGFAWYRTTLAALAGAHRRLHFEDVDDKATVYLNGKQIAVHEGYGKPFDVTLDSAWRDNAPNELAVLVENTDGPGGVNGSVSLETVAAGDEIPVQGWKMRGGVDYPGRGAQWTAAAGSMADGAPAFYRATFDTVPPGETGPHPVLRIATTGLSHGFVWLNGHNLGRYPEKIPVDGLYLPECWQKKGRNELVIFDEEGHSPAQVELWVEQAASRIVVPMRER